MSLRVNPVLMPAASVLIAAAAGLMGGMTKSHIESMGPFGEFFCPAEKYCQRFLSLKTGIFEHSRREIISY